MNLQPANFVLREVGSPRTIIMLRIICSLLIVTASTALAADEAVKSSAVDAKPDAEIADSDTSRPTDVPLAKDASDTAESETGDSGKAKESTNPLDPTAQPKEKYPVDEDEWLTADPLLIIDEEMNSVVTDMKKSDLFRPHTTTQPRIIARFDRLIEMLERKKSGAGGAGLNPTTPAGDSGLGGGPDQAGKLRAASDEPGAMEKLAPNQRKKIQQAAADGFPPGFEDVLSDYYRRLAETKAAE